MADNIWKYRFREFELLSDEQILEELGRRFEALRRVRQIPDVSLIENGGVKKDALANFKKGRNVSLLNFIKILRGARMLESLEKLLPVPDPLSPMAMLETSKALPPARVRKKKKITAKKFQWGDE